MVRVVRKGIEKRGWMDIRCLQGNAAGGFLGIENRAYRLKLAQHWDISFITSKVCTGLLPWPQHTIPTIRPEIVITLTSWHKWSLARM